MSIWDDHISPALVSCACSSKPIMKQRAKVVPKAVGRTLEIGSGSGTNFRFYDRGAITELIAVEPSAAMMRRARAEAARLGMADRISFVEGGAEALAIDDGSVDTAVVTFVLCTIPDWEAALAELRRVLKPGGRIFYSEHGLSPDAGVAKWQRRVEPVWKRLAGGCHLTRDTAAMLASAGFGSDWQETMYLPGTPRIAGYVSWGSAKLTP